MTTAPSTDDSPGLLARVAGSLPVDLVATVASLGVGLLVFGSGAETATVRALAGFAFVLLVPGYALVSALFPGRARGTIRRPSPPSGYSPGTAERFALAYGCSLALLPLVAVAYGLLGLPFEPSTVLVGLAVLVLALVAVALARRFALPRGERYRPPSLLEFGTRFRTWLGRGGALDTALSAVLTVAVLAALASVAYGLAAPTDEAAYTSVALVTENESGPGYVASDYPRNLTVGESRELTVRVQNEHDRPVEYAVVGELQRVRGVGTGSLTVVQRRPVTRANRTVGAGSTWNYSHAVAPSAPGERLRLAYYVYRGAAPATPTRASAERVVFVWVNVAPAGGSAALQ